MKDTVFRHRKRKQLPWQHNIKHFLVFVFLYFYPFFLFVFLYLFNPNMVYSSVYFTEKGGHSVVHYTCLIWGALILVLVKLHLFVFCVLFVLFCTFCSPTWFTLLWASLWKVVHYVCPIWGALILALVKLQWCQKTGINPPFPHATFHRVFCDSIEIIAQLLF